MNYALVNYPDIDYGKINEYRKKYDPSINILRPHITLMVDIPTDDIEEEQLINHIKSVIAPHSPFTISLEKVSTPTDELFMFLDVGKGKDELKKIHEEFYAGILSKYTFPYKPFTPHITIGVFTKKDAKYNKALQEANAIDFNTSFTAESFHLIKGDGNNPVSTIREFFVK